MRFGIINYCPLDFISILILICRWNAQCIRSQTIERVPNLNPCVPFKTIINIVSEAIERCENEALNLNLFKSFVRILIIKLMRTRSDRCKCRMWFCVFVVVFSSSRRRRRRRCRWFVSHIHFYGIYYYFFFVEKKTHLKNTQQVGNEPHTAHSK